MRKNLPRNAVPRRYKTVVQRAGATLIDGILFFPVRYFLPGFVCGILLFAYRVAMHGRYGQTLGKMAFDVKVLAADEQTAAGYTRSFLRELAYWAPLLPTFFWESSGFDRIFFYELVVILLDLAVVLTNNRRRALHDLLAGTVVLDKKEYRSWEFEYEAAGS